jgi:CRP-like cAMP-binding protein
MTLLAPHPRDLPDARGLFSACSARDLNVLRRRATEVTVAAGTVIHAAGDPSKWVYVVVTGSAVSEDLGSLRVLEAGDVHGARPLLAGEGTCGSLVALTEVSLFVLGRNEFTGLLAQNAGFAHGIARLLAGPPVNRR